MKIEKKTGSYNERRYSKPWIARVGFSQNPRGRASDTRRKKGKMKLTKIKKELEQMGYLFNSHKITKANCGRDENSMPLLRDQEILWVRTGAGDVAVTCNPDGSNLHIFSHNGWAYLENTHDSIIKAFGSMPASVEESNQRKRELLGKITSSTAATAQGIYCAECGDQCHTPEEKEMVLCRAHIPSNNGICPLCLNDTGAWSYDGDTYTCDICHHVE